MSFMEMQIFKKGALYSCYCAKCGATMYTHEWFHMDFNDMRDAMEAGTLRCDECSIGRADPDTFRKERNSYAGWYSAPGYMDCTLPMFGSNLRTLKRELRDMYGEE